MMGISWPLIIAFCAFLGIVADSKKLIGDGDTFWHVAAGQWMVEHGRPITLDPFSHTMPGVEWVSHEWLASVILYATHSVGGWPGVILLVGSAFALTAGLLSRFLFDRLEPIYAFLLSVVALGSIYVHWLARPHALALPILVFWAIRIIQSADRGVRPDWWLLGILVLWANLHGSFVVGLGLILIFGAEAVFSANNRSRQWALGRQWATFFFLAVLACLLTPHGLTGLLHPFRMTQMSFMLGHIGEWQSPDFHRLTFQEFWILGLLALGLLAGLRIPLLRLALLLFVVHLSLKHVRHVSLLGALLPLLIAQPLAYTLSNFRKLGKDADGLDRFFNRFRAPANKVVGALLFAVAPVIGFLMHQEPIAARQSVAPAEAVAQVGPLGLQGNVFNTYIFGGYLIYSGIPPFVDGRADMYGDPFIKEFAEAHAGVPGKLQPLLDQYQVQWTLLTPKAPAVALLDSSEIWKRVYTDDYAVIHQRVPQRTTQDLIPR
jgi:hypothetical protein